MKDKSYRIYDSTINICSEVPRSNDDFFAHDRETFASIKRTMKKAGYIFRQDVTVAKSIRRGHFAGYKDDVHFVCDVSPIGIKLEFYEDVIRDNKCGGRYHFDKMEKMPYLRRMKVRLIHEKLAARLEILGFTDSTPITSKSAYAFVLQDRADLIAFQGEKFYENPVYWTYGNSEDADKRTIIEGQVKYFRDWSGHLLRGEVWHHINNMWWVIVNKSEVHNIASFELFDYDPARHPRKESKDPLPRMERKLSRLVERQEFEKCGALRDAIKRLKPQVAVS